MVHKIREKKKKPVGRPKKNKGGRPTVMTDEVLYKLQDAFSYGCTDAEACLHANINPNSLYDYEKKNPEFSERKKLLKKKPILLARTTVVAALKSDPSLSLKVLERLAKKEWALREEIQVSKGKDFDNLTDEELDQAIAELQGRKKK